MKVWIVSNMGYEHNFLIKGFLRPSSAMKFADKEAKKAFGTPIFQLEPHGKVGPRGIAMGKFDESGKFDYNDYIFVGKIELGF